jgi:transcriptional regulator with XRE-family HTH domain
MGVRLRSERIRRQEKFMLPENIFTLEAYLSECKALTASRWTTLSDAMTAKELLQGRLTALLRQRKRSQTDLARAIGRSPSWLNGILKGQKGISLPALDAVARELGVDVPDLFIDRDQFCQGTHVQQVLHPLLKEAPNDPAARAAFVRKLLEAYELIIAELVAVAAETVTSQSTPAEYQSSDSRSGDRTRRLKGHRKLKEGL